MCSLMIINITERMQDNYPRKGIWNGSTMQEVLRRVRLPLQPEVGPIVVIVRGVVGEEPRFLHHPFAMFTQL